MISVPSVGLEFESERTAGLEMTVAMLLALAEQDMRDNAQQIQNTESADAAETHGSLSNFFAQMEGLRTVFPWTFVLRCPMSRATIEVMEANDAQILREEFLVPMEHMERVQVRKFFFLFSFFSPFFPLTFSIDRLHLRISILTSKIGWRKRQKKKGLNDSNLLESKYDVSIL